MLSAFDHVILTHPSHVEKKSQEPGHPRIGQRKIQEAISRPGIIKQTSWETLQVVVVASAQSLQQPLEEGTQEGK
jgi:hypothetical protein